MRKQLSVHGLSHLFWVKLNKKNKYFVNLHRSTCHTGLAVVISNHLLTNVLPITYHKVVS